MKTQQWIYHQLFSLIKNGLLTTFFSIACCFSNTLVFASNAPQGKELMGKAYSKSVVAKSEKNPDLEAFVIVASRKLLPKPHRWLAKKISSTILAEAKAYNLDPLFLMAVIQNESSFDPKRIGSVGEIGLMQIKPETAQWIAKTYHLKYKSKRSLKDCAVNIRIGAALMDKLRDQFESESRLYLSAYNIGARKIRQLSAQNIKPKDYVLAVMKRYLALHRALNSKGELKYKAEIALQNISKITINRKTSSINSVVSKK